MWQCRQTSCAGVFPASPWAMRFPSFLIGVFMVVQPARAWWDGGHKAIALIAYDHLSESERAWVMTRLEAHPTREELFELPLREEFASAAPDADTRARWFFAQAAIWSDLIRRDGGYPNAKEINAAHHHSTWHYTDLAVFPDNAARAALAAKAAPPPMDWQPGMTEPEEGFNSIQTLRRVLHELADPARDHGGQGVNLCWLFHCLGDTHQPCHCAQIFIPEKLPDGCEGANRIMILGLKSAQPVLTSDVLHAFWDSLWNDEKNGLADVSARLAPLKADAALWSKGAEAARELDPVEWLKEGHALAESHVYSPALLRRLASTSAQPNTRSSRGGNVMMVSMTTLDRDAYVREARFVSRQQMVTAGLRLAAVLKDVIARSH
ncbi:MAG TPA: hypothetical protein DIT64_10010 [Verrucomicrobiales bacterium]|nr:hypothetical protein [Verrucomicrobiales bacterium]